MKEWKIQKHIMVDWILGQSITYGMGEEWIEKHY
jgi:hypothetical protein